MKNLALLISFFFSSFCIAQLDGSLLLGLKHATTAELVTITNPIEGSILYNSTEKKVVQFNGASWVDAVELPSDLQDGDDDTTYSAGTGLLLNNTMFSVNNSTITPDWSNITNIPTNLDTSSNNEIQVLSKTGNSIMLSIGGGSITETETDMVQNTSSGIITYTRESGGNSTANVVSMDSNNSISVGADGGAFLEQNITTNTIQVDRSVIWAGVVNDTDIHSNGTLTVNQSRADIGWSFTGPSTISYSGSPDHVIIDLMAVVNNTGSHYAAPHIRVFRNGQQIGEGGAYHLDNSNSYSGRMTTNLNMVDSDPGTNPVYTFTTLEDDTRTMNNPTITSLSPISLIAVERTDVVVSISN